MHRLLKLIGFDHGWQMASGFDPHDDSLRTQRVAFEMEVDGERVVCTKQYNILDAARDPGKYLADLGAQMRREVAWEVLLAARPERDYIRQAIAMYEPGVPFWHASRRACWRTYLKWLVRSYVRT